MNLKYYLRGLGLGIVMTAIIMGIAAHGKETSLTEEEIVERAKTLGMIEEEQLEEYLEEARAETEERVRKEIAQELEAASAPTGGSGRLETPGGQEESDGQVPESGQESEGDQSRTGNQAEAAGGTDPVEDVQRGPDGRTYPAGDDIGIEGDQAEPEEEIVFTIKKGETPYSIGKRLEEEGLLPEDANFDRFLVDNGYDMKVVASEYRIPTDADMETIAKIITKQDR